MAKGGGGSSSTSCQLLPSRRRFRCDIIVAFRDFTTFGEAKGLAPRGLDLDATSLARLRPEPTVLPSIATVASADIGSIPSSPWGSSLLDYFSTDVVLAEGLEHPDREGAVWECFLHLWLEVLVQVEIVCPRVLHCLQNRGNDSYITCWDKGTLLGRMRLIEVGRSASKSISTSNLA